MDGNSNHKHRGLIHCGMVKVHVLLPFVVSFLFVGRSYVASVICGKDKNNFQCSNDFYIFTIIMFIGESLNFVFILLSKILKKRAKQLKKQHKKKNNKTFTLVPSSTIMKKPRRSHQLLLVLLTSFIYCVTTTAINYILYSAQFKDRANVSELSIELRLFNLFFISFFSYIILSLPFRRHQILACCLVATTIILFLVMALTQDAEIDIIVIIISVYFVFSIREVLHKYLMEIKLMSSVLIVFIEGVMGFLMIIIFTLIMRYNFINAIGVIFSDMFLGGLFVLYFFLCFFYDFASIITKFFFEPTVMPVAYSFSVICWKVILLSSGKAVYYQASIFIIGAILAFFGCLVYNEIIILTFWNFERDTKIEITMRSNLDYTGNELNLTA